MSLRDNPGAAISGGAHVLLLAAILVSFSHAAKFDDAQETVPVDLMSNSEFNQIMKGEKTAPLSEKPLSVAVDDKGAVYVMDQPVEMGQLADKLKELAKAGFDERIYVRGANQVNYGKIAEVMSIITTAGYKKVALVTDPNKN